MPWRSRLVLLRLLYKRLHEQDAYDHDQCDVAGALRMHIAHVYICM